MDMTMFLSIQQDDYTLTKSYDTATNVWGGTNYPYLQSVETSGEDEYTQYSSEVLLNKEEFISKIKEYHSNFLIDFNLDNQIEILEYTAYHL